MQNWLKALVTVGCSLVLALPVASQPDAKPTTIYLVRHAEKDLTDPSARNPELTAAGVTRAQHLADKLRTVPIQAIYSTSFARTVNTVKPVADQKKLTIGYYQAQDLAAMQQLIQQQRGKTILICGHSNTILPIIRSVGAKPPLDTILDTQYDNLFKLVIQPDGRAQATVEKYN